MRILFRVILLCFLSTLTIYAQNKKTITISRTNEAPRIDGFLNDEVWGNAPVATDFLQIRPYNGKPAKQKTVVQFCYDNAALYVGAKVYDSAPDSIITRLGSRDDMAGADYFGVYLDPFNDAKTAYGFFVTCTGIQIDMRATQNGMEDDSWDAVWKSEVRLVENGYVVEMAIPYSALRFPQTPMQTWGLNMFRSVNRKNNNNSWNHIDNTVQGFINQAGELHGIKDIEPSLRLSFTPYVSGYYLNDKGTSGYSVKGGLDLKYGISESFTLDMMLIPDFGQVQSDDVELNLSPFESYFSEQREFFVEGTELFSKAGIFYSRRIGAAPARKDNVNDQLDSTQIVIENPGEAQIVNTTKITGKTESGLAVGILNGMTLPAYAVIKDTTNNSTRNYLTQAFTNYNVTVFDQTIGKHSNLAVINTNVNRTWDNSKANVLGTEFKFADGENKYAVNGRGAYSMVWPSDARSEFGHTYYLNAGKISGNFTFSLSHLLESHKYNPNDLGFLFNPNEVRTDLNLHYYWSEPMGKIAQMGMNFQFGYEQLYKPRRFVSNSVQFSHWFNFLNNMYAGYYANYRFEGRYDYFEPRVEGFNYYFHVPRGSYTEVWFGTDQSKQVSGHFEFGIDKNAWKNQFFYRISANPRIQLTDQLMVGGGARYIRSLSEKGWVELSSVEDTIYFGNRNRNQLELVFEGSYSINSQMIFSARARHFWSLVKYDKYYELEQNGYLNSDTDYNKNNDLNFNVFTIDAGLTWNFAPGSQLSFVYKTNLDDGENEVIRNYIDNFRFFWRTGQSHSVSLRVLYYLDYHYLKSWRGIT
jgi:hypothetical protein